MTGYGIFRHALPALLALLLLATAQWLFVADGSAETGIVPPAYKVIPAAATDRLTPASRSMEGEGSEWTRSHGNAHSTRYSALRQINRRNVGRLQIAWVYHSGDGKGNIQSNPIIADGVMYAPTVGQYMVALNAETGKEIWRFKPGGRPAHRGLIYWKGNGKVGPRVYFTSGDYLFALDPQSGRPVETFGNDGKVPSGGVVAPAIYQDIIVVANWNRISGHDVVTGRPLWTFHVLGEPRPREPPRRGGNCWGGISLDPSRGIAYVATGSPHPNFIGVNHPGRNQHANSVIALDARTGRVIWSFQEIRHDIWDLDLPAPPVLVTVQRNGKRVDAVAQVTKLGNTLLLDRLTGEPLFPFRLRRAPASRLTGEKTWEYQPDIETPQPFARQVFTKDDVTDISPQARAFVMEQIEKANFGWFEPFEEGRPTVFFGIYGGAEWPGAAFDSDTGRLFVTANELPSIITVSRSRNRVTGDTQSPGANVYGTRCAACHGGQLEGRAMAPPLTGLVGRMSEQEIGDVVSKGRNDMPPIKLTAEESAQLMSFLFGRDAGASPSALNDGPNYVSNGYPKLRDHDGYPGCTPPWGTLNAIDLNTGKIVWRVPLGEYTELTRRGIPQTGTENFGGAIVTAGGLVFASGTRDLKIRAFDKDTGRELWSHQLPFGGFAPPATYQVRGRQYVVIPATGGGKLGGEMGDAYVAFALPAKD